MLEFVIFHEMILMTEGNMTRYKNTACKMIIKYIKDSISEQDTSDVNFVDKFVAKTSSQTNRIKYL